MLTPRFDIYQDRNNLKVVIKAPCARVSDTEIYIEDTEFKFYSKPYYLRLNLPGKVVEDGREKATYDAETGTFTVLVPKECPGEHFEGLDLLTKLLAPKGARSASGAGVEVLGTGTDDAEEEEEEEIDWQVEQVPWWENQPQSEIQPGMKYGFANRRSGVFSKLQEELHDVVDVREPDRLTHAECREARIAAEQAQFDPDHYLADLYEDDIIQELLRYQPPWVKELHKLKTKVSGTDCSTDHPEEDIFVFSEEEKEQLLRLPKREYLLDGKTLPVVCFGLVDILFAYCYNNRTTEGKDNVESAWTVCKLSVTLSWLESFSSLREAVLSSYRRSLSFPLYRSWDLTMAVLQDTRDIITAGRRHVLRCLLQIHRLLSADENKYILNDLYITDYCVWVQTAGDSVFSSMAQALTEIHLSKSDMNFDLEELEHAARLVQEEEGTQVVDPMANLSLQDTESHSCVTTGEVVPEMVKLSLENSVEKHVLRSEKLRENLSSQSKDDSDDSDTSTETDSSSESESDVDEEATKEGDKAATQQPEVQATSETTVDKDLQLHNACGTVDVTSSCGDQTGDDEEVAKGGEEVAKGGDKAATQKPEVQATSETITDKDLQTDNACRSTDATSSRDSQREEKDQEHSWLEVPDVNDRYRIVQEGRCSDTVDGSLNMFSQGTSSKKQLITELEKT
ncbi:SHQ1 [Branchiostoma lanceolatum]|uniref:Protein SHQ1 homolog n=1 Tax=Branchiostoma lanceolatum TaxID=7740 RepID=A0A8J9ZZ11_BRALA|nr:SHQ1 [Branchiostoma lanceolatum]